MQVGWHQYGLTAPARTAISTEDSFLHNQQPQIIDKAPERAKNPRAVKVVPVQGAMQSGWHRYGLTALARIHPEDLHESAPLQWGCLC